MDLQRLRNPSSRIGFMPRRPLKEKPLLSADQRLKAHKERLVSAFKTAAQLHRLRMALLKITLRLRALPLREIRLVDTNAVGRQRNCLFHHRHVNVKGQVGLTAILPGHIGQLFMRQDKRNSGSHRIPPSRTSIRSFISISSYHILCGSGMHDRRFFLPSFSIFCTRLRY